MKKINLVLLSMMMLVLAQCTKSEIKPDPVDVSMKGEVSMGDGSKAVILPESGEINWESGDFLCFYQPDHGLVPLMINNVTGTGNNHHGKVVGRASLSKIQKKDDGTWVLPKYLVRDLYYVGGKNHAGNLQLNISTQTGKEENIGDYLIMRADNVQFKKDTLSYESGNYNFDRANFFPRNSVALFNLEGYENQDITVEFMSSGYPLSIYNEFKMDIDCNTIEADNWFDEMEWGHSSLIDLTEQYINNAESEKITITDPSARTYLVFNTFMFNQEYNAYAGLPLSMVFKCGDEVIGTVDFPKGLTFGKYYTSVNFSPINLTIPSSGAKSLIEEHELF